MASFRRYAVYLYLGLAAASLAVGPASAHGDLEGVEDLSAHLSDYGQEVSGMSDTAHLIAQDYAAGEDVTGRVDNLVGTWEEVEFHEAVETEAMAFYSPIWVALGELGNAVAESGNGEQAQEAAEALDRSLYEALGALKYIAANDDHGSSHGEGQGQGQSQSGSQNAGQGMNGGGASSPAEEITAIKSNLDQVVQLYREDNVEQASQLLHRTYMQRFEGIEGPLIEQDAQLVTGLEKDFNANLPILFKNDAPAEEVASQVESMQSELDRAKTLLDNAGQNKSSVF